MCSKDKGKISPNKEEESGAKQQCNTHLHPGHESQRGGLMTAVSPNSCPDTILQTLWLKTIKIGYLPFPWLRKAGSLAGSSAEVRKSVGLSSYLKVLGKIPYTVVRRWKGHVPKNWEPQLYHNKELSWCKNLNELENGIFPSSCCPVSMHAKIPLCLKYAKYFTHDCGTYWSLCFKCSNQYPKTVIIWGLTFILQVF